MMEPCVFPCLSDWEGLRKRTEFCLCAGQPPEETAKRRKSFTNLFIIRRGFTAALPPYTAKAPLLPPLPARVPRLRRGAQGRRPWPRLAGREIHLCIEELKKRNGECLGRPRGGKQCPPKEGSVHSPAPEQNRPARSERNQAGRFPTQRKDQMEYHRIPPGGSSSGKLDPSPRKTVVLWASWALFTTQKRPFST